MMKGIAFICGVLFVLMGMGHWQQDKNPGWLAVSIVVALFTLAGGVSALFKRGK
jgi:UDP-N-acetylmuramyl pentapeptide phosphotransferase/UDP-N-acetylglucosamine-1-phosphate transferase